MTPYLTAYLNTVVVFLLIDFVWLSIVAKRFYWERLGHLLADQPNIAAAAAFYAVYAVGIVFFAVLPAIRADSAATAFVYGAAFGFFAYATYDMTNFATLKNWPLTVVIVDVLWGTVLTGTSAFIGYLGTRYLLGS